MAVVVFGVILVVFALVMDFREVMLTLTPELAHCGGGFPKFNKVRALRLTLDF